MGAPLCMVVNQVQVPERSVQNRSKTPKSLALHRVRISRKASPRRPPAGSDTRCQHPGPDMGEETAPCRRYDIGHGRGLDLRDRCKSGPQCATSRWQNRWRDGCHAARQHDGRRTRQRSRSRRLLREVTWRSRVGGPRKLRRRKRPGFGGGFLELTCRMRCRARAPTTAALTWPPCSTRP